MTATPAGGFNVDGAISCGRGLERHGYAIHAIAKTGRPRSFIENVVKMSPAAAAVDLDTRHCRKRVFDVPMGRGAPRSSATVATVWLSSLVFEENKDRSQPAQANAPGRCS